MNTFLCVPNGTNWTSVGIMDIEEDIRYIDINFIEQESYWGVIIGNYEDREFKTIVAYPDERIKTNLEIDNRVFKFLIYKDQNRIFVMLEEQ